MTPDAERAYVAGLRLLGRRELSEVQLRARLARRQFESGDIEAAVRRLIGERALDDRRVALACARTETSVRGRGRARVVRQIEGLGIARDVARAAVSEVFAEIDEGALLERAIERRLRHGIALDDPSGVRRLHRYLIAQGFDPGSAMTAIELRTRTLARRV